jgi:predicted metal-binding membrane protein
MDMSGMIMAPQIAAWTVGHVVFIFTMWTVMMVGMMTPSVAPMILIYTQVARQAGTQGHVFAPAGYFVLGYLFAWTAFATAATAAQYGLEQAALLSPMMAGTSKFFAGVILMGAGFYQLSPVTKACLEQCRSPLAFMQSHGGFQSDALGSLQLGALHGAYCIGCCWAIMALLFVVGIMNVLWIAAFSIIVLAEKTLPGGRYLSIATGAISFGLGVWMMAS